MTKIFESNIEEFVIELLQSQGFEYLSPEEQEKERKNLSTVIFRNRLKQAIAVAHSVGNGLKTAG